MAWWDATQAEAMICQSTLGLIPQGMFLSYGNLVKKTTKLHMQRSLKCKKQSQIHASEQLIRFLLTVSLLH